MTVLADLPPYDHHEPKSLDQLLQKELTPQALEEARQAIIDLGREADRYHNTKQDAVAVGILAGWRLCTRYWLAAETQPKPLRDYLQYSKPQPR